MPRPVTSSLLPTRPPPSSARRRGPEALHQVGRAVQHQGEEPHRPVRQLLERHGGELPADRASLEALPGVGRKTASIILNMVFGRPRSPSTLTSSGLPIAPDSPGQDAARSRDRAARQHTVAVQKGRTPLVAVARPLRVHRALTGLPHVHHPRSVRVSSQDAGARAAGGAAAVAARAAGGPRPQPQAAAAPARVNERRGPAGRFS